MSFDTSGNFTRRYGATGWQNDAAAGIKIRSDLHDNHDEDLAQGLSNTITRHGWSTVAADIPWGGKRITNLADPIDPQDAMTLKKFADGGIRYDVGQSLTLAQLIQLHTNINDLSSVLPKAANYTLLLTDRSKLLFVTADCTITLPAAAEVGNDYSVYFRTKGGKFTIPRVTGVLVEGLEADYIVPDLSSGAIYCDGVNWQVIYNRPGDTSFMGPYRNKIINGNFDLWTRATSQTTSAVGSDDRWGNYHVGDTKTATLAWFTSGQTAVPGDPTFYSTTTWTSVVAPANYCKKSQYIENVRTLQGRKATLTFWAMAGAARDIAVEFQQSFGTGGTPSALVSLPLGKKSITASWAKYQIVFDVPSIAGKSIGTGNNDTIGIVFWFDAGGNFATAASSLGQSSGSVSLARISLVEGDATGEPDPFAPRHIGEETLLCERYCQRGGGAASFSGDTGAAANYYARYEFKTHMHHAPTLTLTNNSTSGFTATVGSIGNPSQWGFYETRTGAAGYIGGHFGSTFLAEAEL